MSIVASSLRKKFMGIHAEGCPGVSMEFSQGASAASNFPTSCEAQGFSFLFFSFLGGE